MNDGVGPHERRPALSVQPDDPPQTAPRTTVDGLAQQGSPCAQCADQQASPYVGLWMLRNGTPVLIRPIRPDDEPLMAQFHCTLSSHTVYLRYFHAIHLRERVAHDRLTHICHNDPGLIALVAEHHDPETGERTILGVGRLIALPDGEAAEFALLVGDTWQRQGLGHELLARLLAIGRKEGRRWIVADILPENHGMQHICRALGFQLHFDAMEGVVKARIDLAS